MKLCTSRHIGRQEKAIGDLSWHPETYPFRDAAAGGKPYSISSGRLFEQNSRFSGEIYVSMTNRAILFGLPVASYLPRLMAIRELSRYPRCSCFGIAKGVRCSIWTASCRFDTWR